MPIVLHANCPPCQLSSMPIIRMLIVLHANNPHVNYPRTIFRQLNVYILKTSTYPMTICRYNARVEIIKI